MYKCRISGDISKKGKNVILDKNKCKKLADKKKFLFLCFNEKKIFIITGEESGDKLASLIFSKTNTQDYEFKAIGGQNLKNIGIPILFDNKDITYFGITDVILNIFKIFRKINYTVTAVC